MNNFKNDLWRHIVRLEWLIYFAGVLYYLAFLIFPASFMDGNFWTDPMSWTGFGLLLIGLLLARVIQQQFAARALSVVRNGAIHLSESEFRIETWVQMRAAWVFVPVFLSLVTVYFIGLHHAGSDQKGLIHLQIGGLMGIYMVSARFAFGIATGMAAHKLARAENQFVLTPTHPDRASGFGNLGFFYLDQALVLLLPAVFMVIWIVIVQINIGQYQREDFANEIMAYMTGDPQPALNLSWIAKAYVRCDMNFYSLQDCGRGDISFIWRDQFVQLIFYNLLIFFFSWIVPMWFLGRRMKEYRTSVIAPDIRKMEKSLRIQRAAFVRTINGEGPPALVTLDQASGGDVRRLAAYRNCPGFPIPIWTAVTTGISNVSAVLGILGASVL